MDFKLFQKNLLLVLFADSLLISAAWYGSFYLRFNFNIPSEFISMFSRTLPIVIPLKIITFYLFDLYRGMWRYVGLADLYKIITALITSSLLFALLINFSIGFSGFARSVLIIDFILSVILISGHRVSVRLYFWIGAKNGKPRISPFYMFKAIIGRKAQASNRKRLLIIGAGDCGEKIYREIHDNPQLKYSVAGFIDDDSKKMGRQIHGVPVVGPINKIMHFVNLLKADEAIIAIPSATSQQMRNIVNYSKESDIPFKTLPGMGELINGKVSVKAIRDVAYRDLLGREVIRLDEEIIGEYLEGTSVFISGAGGSIGSELCRQICRFKPQKVILYDQAESPLYNIEIELKQNFPYIEIIPVLSDIKSQSCLKVAFNKHFPNVVFHAAAYKHVPMLELNPWEAVKDNIIGTQQLVEVTKQFQVDRFVFVSTDKVVRPTNVMGASKRIAELIVQGQNGCNLSRTRFITVRFGNVLGSVGSVVPLFKKQIEIGGPVTVTHPDVMRYFMTIPEACQLILQAGAMGQGGEIFILDMGTPIKIVDMARDLIRLSGFEPEVDIKIEFTGLRPGEKLSEELITEGEGIVPTGHEKILVIRGQSCDQSFLTFHIGELKELAEKQDGVGIRKKIKEILPEYTPANF